MDLITLSLSPLCTIDALLLLLSNSYTLACMCSKIKQSSLLTRMTSFSLIIFGCPSLYSVFTSLRLVHSSQVQNFRFIFLIATYSPVSLFCAKLTCPKVPSPKDLMRPYLSIKWQFILKMIISLSSTIEVIINKQIVVRLMSVSLADLLQKCLDTEQGYQRYSDVIASYVADPTKNM